MSSIRNYKKIIIFNIIIAIICHNWYINAMKFDDLLHILGTEELFASDLLLAGRVDPKQIRRQLSRWTESGRILQLRRGRYVLADPYRKREPHPFCVANFLVRASYVSLHTALSHYNMIPEYSAAVTSVTSGRPGVMDTVLGRYEYRHIKKEFFCDYYLADIGMAQKAFIAAPEKALFDLIYLTPKSDFLSYLRELRLNFPEQFQLNRFLSIIEKLDSAKLKRAADHIMTLFEHDFKEYESL